MIKKVFIIFLTGVFFINTGLIYSAERLDLSALIKEAQKNNLDILAAKSRYEAAKARIPQAKSLENPSIGFTSGKIPRGTLKLNKTMAEDRMLSINQAIPWFGKLSLKGKIALVESQMIAGEYRDKELQIINEVKQDYYALFMNYKKTELNQASLIFLKEIIEIAEAFF